MRRRHADGRRAGISVSRQASFRSFSLARSLARSGHADFELARTAGGKMRLLKAIFSRARTHTRLHSNHGAKTTAMKGPLGRLGATIAAGSRRHGVRILRRPYSTPSKTSSIAPPPRVAPSLRQHLASSDPSTSSLTITAWVRSIRVHSKVAFLSVTDGSLLGRDTFQAVVKGDVMRQLLPTLTLGSAVRLEGEIGTSEKGRAPELQVTSAAVVGPNDPEVSLVHPHTWNVSHADRSHRARRPIQSQVLQRNKIQTCTVKMHTFVPSMHVKHPYFEYALV